MNYLPTTNYLTAWRRAVDFGGTSTRREFWVFVGINLLILISVAVVFLILEITYIAPTGFDQVSGAGVLAVLWFYVWFIVLLVPSFSLTLRRIRDSTDSGWWVLLLLIPYVGWFFVLLMTIMPTRGSGDQLGEVSELQLNQYRNPNYITAWRRTSDLYGCSKRAEYWSFTLINMAVGLLVLLIAGIIDSLAPQNYTGAPLGGASVLTVIAFAGIAFLIAAFVPYITVLIRRVRDATGSGWWTLLMFVPLVGGLIVLIITLMPTSGR